MLMMRDDGCNDYDDDDDDDGRGIIVWCWLLEKV